MHLGTDILHERLISLDDAPIPRGGVYIFLQTESNAILAPLFSYYHGVGSCDGRTPAQRQLCGGKTFALTFGTNKASVLENPETQDLKELS